MKIPENTNPALVASDDETRWILSHLLVTGGHLVATDGRRLLVQKVDMEDGDKRSDFLIGKAFFKKAFDAAKQYEECADPDCDGSCCYEDNIVRLPVKIEVGEDSLTTDLGDETAGVFKPTFEGEYPNWPQVIPASRGTVKLNLNARMLLECVQALAFPSDQVCIEFDHGNPGLPFVLTNDNCSDRFAVQMPLTGTFYPRGPVDVAENTAWAFAQEEKRKREESKALAGKEEAR
jgi:hypothetical protein